MIRKPTVEELVFALAMALSLIAIAIIVASPADFRDSNLVYKGF
jgi:hypothetical protein